MAVTKTELGIQVMKDRSVSLSAQQRSALILCDGKRSADDVVRMTAGVGVSMEDIQALATMGLVELSDAAAQTAPQAATAAADELTAQTATPAPAGDFSIALNAAISLCSNLGFKGFGLNMALTGVDSLEKLQKLAPEIRRAAGDVKYKPLHAQIFGKPL
ncbi:hypothetical protein [Variovorax sp. PCZ-1]|uniref:hypothetical protein n=1 Tax=Variovorax sp. PCZ-1 TaxID=2835533 RepID=UPI001BD1B666|nr:hypothetical protein [Variovorax sp. PCZ-1]MBS7808283.1 hypothetical protein [Variovorax sp. PCZ-1]